MQEQVKKELKEITDQLEVIKKKRAKMENHLQEKEKTHLKLKEDSEKAIEKFKTDVIGKLEAKAKENGEASQLIQQKFMEVNAEIYKLEHQQEILLKITIDAK